MFECKKNCGLCCGPVPIKKETYEKNIAKAQPHILTDLGTHVLALQGVTAKCAFLTDEVKVSPAYVVAPSGATSCQTPAGVCQRRRALDGENYGIGV